MATMLRSLTLTAMPRYQASRAKIGRAMVVTKAGKCACGKTSDAAGNCDGSHAKKMCGCGNTKSPKGFCDGSHATATAAPAKKMCGCGKTGAADKSCDGSHAKK